MEDRHQWFLHKRLLKFLLHTFPWPAVKVCFETIVLAKPYQKLLDLDVVCVYISKGMAYLLTGGCLCCRYGAVILSTRHHSGCHWIGIAPSCVKASHGGYGQVKYDLKCQLERHVCYVELRYHYRAFNGQASSSKAIMQVHIQPHILAKESVCRMVAADSY